MTRADRHDGAQRVNTDPERNARLVRDVEIVCSGSAARSHAPRLIALPQKGTVHCPDCETPYRRAAEWENLTRAIWPKRE